GNPGSRGRGFAQKTLLNPFSFPQFTKDESCSDARQGSLTDRQGRLPCVRSSSTRSWRSSSSDAARRSSSRRGPRHRELPDRELPDWELPDGELPDRELPDRELPGRELPDREQRFAKASSRFSTRT